MYRFKISNSPYCNGTYPPVDHFINVVNLAKLTLIHSYNDYDVDKAKGLHNSTLHSDMSITPLWELK